MALSAIVLETLLDDLAAKARSDGGWERPVWNRTVKDELIRIGRGEGFKTCASGVPKESGNTWGEWLYDVTWLETTDGFAVCNVPLVAEIEWGTDWEVWEDFQKLLLARANVRVMIFDESRGLMARLKDQIERFALSKKNDRYLLASYSTATRRFSVVEYFARG